MPTHLLLCQILGGSVSKARDDGEALFLDRLENSHTVLALPASVLWK